MKGKKVLIVPLNWGLGHATRIIPIIKILKAWGADVTVSGSSQQISLFTGEFNDIRIIHLPYFKMKLGSSYWQLLYYFIQIPNFLLQIRKEHRALSKLLQHENFDLVISDNCYGLWNCKIKSVIITHQLNLKVPDIIKIFQPVFNLVNHRLIRNFTYCWVPDFKGDQNLSGYLSHPVPKNIHASYIGLLSRFSGSLQTKVDKNESNKKNILFILSGPENQRTIFEEILKKQARELEKTYHITFIRGLPDNNAKDLPEGWLNHVSSEEMQTYIFQADLVVCRSGYSSIMDLISLQKPAILVPTPGQTEQKYLAQYLSKKKLFCIQEQDQINVQKGIETIEEYMPKIKSIFQLTDNNLLLIELQKILSTSK